MFLCDTFSTIVPVIVDEPDDPDDYMQCEGIYLQLVIFENQTRGREFFSYHVLLIAIK